MSVPQAPELGRPFKDRFTAADLARAEAMIRAQDLLAGLVELGSDSPVLVDTDPISVIPEVVAPTPTFVPPVERKPPVRPRLPKKVVATAGSVAVRPQVAKPKTAKPTIVASSSCGPETKLSYSDALPSFANDDSDNWQELALCAQVDPEIFFPEKGGSTREAKKVCVSCEVKVECLEKALDADERFGIWGGFSERERRRLKRSGSRAIRPEAEATALSNVPYSRVKHLVDIVEGTSSEDRETIENSLHEDEGRLTKFVQATLALYRQEKPGAMTKGGMDRIFNYFNGTNLWVICENATVEARLRKEIDAMTEFFDELCEDGRDPMQECWQRSQPNESSLQVLHVVPAKPKWLKDTMLAERQAATT